MIKSSVLALVLLAALKREQEAYDYLHISHNFDIKPDDFISDHLYDTSWEQKSVKWLMKEIEDEIKS